MALLKRKHEDFCLLLISLLSFLPLTATFYNDCNGKSFHCVNSTHFMICVDVGGGVSMTVDDLVIKCPPTTFCQSTNNFECEYQESTALNEAIKKSEITNDPTFLNVISLDQASTQIPMFLEDSITSVLPLEKYFISSKPSQISKKDLMMPKIVQNDIPQIDRENGLDLDGMNGNNSQLFFTESTTEIDRLQNNISSTKDTNFTFVPLAINGEEIITNIPNITENALEIKNKESISNSSLPVLDNIITKDMFSKILSTNPKFKPEVGVDSNDGRYILAVNKTNDAINNLDTTSFFLNGTLTNTLSNHSGLEINQSHNVSINVNVLNDSVINNKDLSAPRELKAPSHFVTSQNLKPILTPSERSTVASDNNYSRETQVEKNTTNYESINSLNGTSNMKIDTSQLKHITNESKNFDSLDIGSNGKTDISTSKIEEEYPKNDKHNTTLSNDLVNNVKLKNIQSQNIDLSVNGEINNFRNTEFPTAPIELRNSSGQLNSPENIKSGAMSPDKLKTISYNNSDVDLQMEKTKILNINTTVEQNSKNDNLLSNTTMSNKSLNETNLENIQSQNIGLSVNRPIDNFTNTEDPSIIEIRNSFAQLTASENIKSEITPADKPKATSNNYSNIEMQPESKANDNGNLHSSNITLNATIDANTNTTEEQYPKTDNLLNNTTITNHLVNDLQSENISSQSINLNVKEAKNNFGNTEHSTIIELQNSSAQSFASENIKSEILSSDKPKTFSENNSDIDMQMINETKDNEKINSLNVTLNPKNYAKTNILENQYSENENLFNNTTITNELLNNTRLKNIQNQNIDLNIKGAIKNIGNTDDPTITELRNSSDQSTAFKNIKSETLSSDKFKTISENNSNIDRQRENETNNNENVYYLYNTLNAKADANINTTVEQNLKNDNLLSNTTMSNKSINETNLENIQSQNIGLSVNRPIDNFTNTEDPSIIEIRNSFAQLIASENIKSEITLADKPKATSNNNSNIEMQPESKANDNGNLLSSNISLNAKIDANTNTTEEQYPKTDNLLNNTVITKHLVNDLESENISSQNINLDVKEAKNNFGNTEHSTIIELQNSSAQSFASENIKPEIVSLDKPKTFSENNSEIDMQMKNVTKDNEKINSLNLNPKIYANTNTLENQYSENEHLFNNTTITNELLNNTRLKNIQNQNIDLNIKGAINNIGNTEDPTIIKLRNSSAQSFASENIKSDTLSSDKSKTIIENNSNIDRQMENETNNNENVYYLYNTLNAKTDVNINTTVEQNPKNDNLLSNTAMSNKSANETNLENIQSQNIGLSVNGPIDNFTNTEDPSIIEIRNSFAQLTASENIKSKITPADKPKVTSNNDSNIEMQPESKANDNGNLHSSNISLNAKIDANTNTTEEQYPKTDNLLNNTAITKHLVNDLKSENISNQNINLDVKEAINNFGNTEHSIIIELQNSSAQSSENIKSEILSSDKPKTFSENNSDIDRQKKNEKIIFLNVTLNAKNYANTNTPEDQYSENENLFNNTTITNELLNNTRLKNIQNQNIDLNVKEATNSFGNTEDRNIIELQNTSIQITSPENIISIYTAPDKYKATRNNNSNIKFPLDDNINNNGNAYSSNTTSNVKIDTNTNTRENKHSQNNDMFYNKPVSNELLNNKELEKKQNQNIDLSVNGGTNNFGNIQHPTIPIELRNLFAQSTTTENIKSEIISSENPKSINYDSSDIKKQMEKETNNNENVFSSNSSKTNSLSNITISDELVNSTNLKNIQNQSINPSFKGESNNFRNTEDSTIIESRNIFSKSTISENIKSELMPQDKQKANNNNDSNTEIQAENKTNDNGNVYSSNSSVKIGANTNITEVQYLKNDNLLKNTIILNEVVNNTKLENIHSQNMYLSVNGGINNFGFTEHPNIIELRNLPAQSTATENIKTENISPDKPKTISYHNSDIEMPMENVTNNNENVYSLNISNANANTNTTEEKYSKNESLFRNTNISNELVNNTKLDNIQSQNTYLNVKGAINSFGNTKDKNFIELRNISAQSTVSQNLNSEVRPPDKPKAFSNNDSNIEMQIEEKKEDWYNGTENGIFKGTDVIQPTLSSATSTDNSLTIINNMHENVRKVELQPNSEYYSVFTVAEKITQPTSGKPSFVDQYVIMNNGTIVNNTNDEYLIDGVEIFNRSFDVRPVNGTQSVSNVTIPNIKVQENIIFTHENYRVKNDQNGTIYINNNVSDTNEKLILFNNASKAEENYSGILNISNTTGIENSIQSTMLDKSRKNINYQTNIPTITENYVKAPRKLILLHNTEPIINETVANSSLAKVSSRDKVLTKNKNDPKSLSEKSGILMVNGITNYSLNINEVADTVSDTRMNELNNSVLSNIINSTETITDVLITTDKSFMSTYMLPSINNLDKDQNLHKNVVESSTQTVLAKFQTSTEMFNFSEVSEATKSSVRNVNRSLDRILFGPLKYPTQKNYKEGLNSQAINESLIDSLKYVKFSQIPRSVKTDTPYLPVTIATNNYYTKNVETSSIASNFQEKQVLDVTEEVNSMFPTFFGNETKKNVSIITNREILFDTDISTVHDAQNISKTINIIIKTSSISGIQNLTEQPQIFPEPELRPLIQQNNKYNTETSFSNIVHKNGTLIDTHIKSLLHSSEERNLTKAERPIESDVNTKIFHHYNDTKIATSYNKNIGAKHVKLATTTDTLRRNDKEITKFSTQTYPVLHSDTNMMKLPPASSEIFFNASYYSVKSLNLTNNNNYKVDKIQLNNISDKMGLRDLTTEINSNKVNKNNTIKYDEVRNAGLTVITTKTSSALKNNKSKIIETVTKSSVLGNTRIKPVLPNFFCRNNSRGRFADENNCRRFYICIGNLIPVLGLCPENTVFSEFRKQCTKNVSHCIRHNHFKCSKEGRFSDIWYENIYYICIKDAHQRFVSFKLQCQNGYRLDKTNVTCYKITMPKSSSSSSSTSSKDDDIKVTEKATNKNSEQNKSLKSKSFKCESEGKFSDPTNCRRYYVCSKTSKSKLRRKRKKCDSDEIFDGDKDKCVDKDSHECK